MANSLVPDTGLSATRPLGPIAMSTSVLSPTSPPTTTGAPSPQRLTAPPAPARSFSRLWSTNASDDELEEYLSRMIKKGGEKVERIESLLHDYKLFRDQEFKAFESAALFMSWSPAWSPPQFMSLHSGESARSPPRSVSQRSGVAFKTDLCYMRQLLRSDQADGLSLCIINTIPTKDVCQLFPNLNRTFGSPSRLRRKCQAPRLCALHTVWQEWSLPERRLQDCVDMTEPKEQILRPYTTFPKKRALAATFSLEPGPFWLEIEFQWIREVRKYPTDFWVYVRQYHIALPRSETIRIFIRNTGEDQWRVLAVEDVIVDESVVTAAGPAYREQNLAWAVGRSKQSLSSVKARTNILQYIASVSRQLVVATQMFCDEVLKRVSFLKLQGRRWPSEEKLNYLLHLDDCRQDSCSGLRRAAILLQEIINYINSHTEDVDPALVEVFEDLLADVERLRDILMEIAALITDIRAMIKEQVDLRQIRLTGVLTFLAAIYVPFSFISGMFGMNVGDPLWNTAASSSDVSSKTAAVGSQKHFATRAIRNRALYATANAALSICTANCTTSSAPATTSGLTLAGINDTINAALSSQPSAHLWSFKQFWWISASTTGATIFFPILAPYVFRATLRSFDESRGMWMFIVFFVGGAGAAFMDVYIPHPDLYYVLGIPQGWIAAIFLIRAHLKNAKLKRWIGYATVLVACITFDTAVDNYDDNYYTFQQEGRFGLTGVLPPLYLFIVWVQSGPSYVSKARISNWIDSLPLRVPRIRVPTMIQNWNQIRKYVKDHIWVRGLLIVVASVCNGLASWYIPDLIYLGLAATPIGLFCLHKLANAYELQIDRIKWTIFAGIVAGSIVDWWYGYLTRGYFIGSVLFFPALFLLSYAWAGSLDGRIGRLLQRRFKKRSSTPDPEASGTPVSQHELTQTLNTPAVGTPVLQSPDALTPATPSGDTHFPSTPAPEAPISTVSIIEPPNVPKSGALASPSTSTQSLDMYSANTTAGPAPEGPRDPGNIHTR